MSMTLGEARARVLRAQGLGPARRAASRPADHAAVRALLTRLHVLQIDSVNVLARGHEMPGWTRLGAYPRAALQALVDRRQAFEYWGHEASLVRVDLWPYFQWRMQAARDGQAWGGLVRFAARRGDYIRDVLAELRRRGPTPASALTEPGRARGSWWDWSEAKHALEYLFWTGEVTTTTRTANFERVYDVVERVIPPAVFRQPAVPAAQAQAALLGWSAEALGVATASDLVDYFRLPKVEGKRAVLAMAKAGALREVEVEGWREPAYVSAAAPRRMQAAAHPGALVGPFDPLIWKRDRAERLFGMRYRIEIYTPAPKRVHGYYVLPFLLGDTLVARVDLKADREAKCLRVLAAHAEPTLPAEAPAALARELRALAPWLGCDRVEIGRKGGLAARLRRACLNRVADDDG